MGTFFAAVLPTIVDQGMLNGVLEEIVGMLPIVFPVSVGFIAIRKGVNFVLGALHSA